MGEADMLARYLVGEDPNQTVRDLYAGAMELADNQVSGVDERIWQLILRRPCLLPWFDAGLAMARPDSNVRRRVFTMLAILEANTEYTNYFLSRKKSIWYLFYLMVIGVRTVVRTVIGTIMVKGFVWRYGDA